MRRGPAICCARATKAAVTVKPLPINAMKSPSPHRSPSSGQSLPLRPALCSTANDPREMTQWVQKRHFGRLDRCRLCPRERREMQPARMVAPYALL